jgi:cysteinyl-tRNA synthetase
MFKWTKLAKYWMHNGFVNIDGEKMSKSLGNSFFLKDVLKSYSGEVIRFYLMSHTIEQILILMKRI